MTEFEEIWDASSSSNPYFTDKELEVQRGGNNVFNAMEQMHLNSYLLAYIQFLHYNMLTV